MAKDSRIEHSAAVSAPAERVALALDAVEKRLNALEPIADRDVVAKGLSEAVCAFDAALKEAAAS